MSIAMDRYRGSFSSEIIISLYSEISSTFIKGLLYFFDHFPPTLSINVAKFHQRSFINDEAIKEAAFWPHGARMIIAADEEKPR